MSAVALRFGPMAAAGHRVVRSALRYLCADGQSVAAQEPIAFCTIGVIAGAGPPPFADEPRDFQVAFAPRFAGRVRLPSAAAGGFLDRLVSYRWTEETPVASIEPAGPVPADNPGIPRLLMLAGRRMTEVAEDRSGLLTGWHDRARGWWGEGVPATLLALGTCEQAGTLRGERGAFFEMFAGGAGPAQVAVMQDEPLVPAARILIEQMARSDADMQAIAADAAAGFAALAVPAASGDWLFLGALLAGLARRPITEDYPVLGRSGLVRAPPAAALSLSLTAELPPLLRHRRLGYAIACHPFRLRQAGAATRAWLGAHFEPLPRATEDIAADYRRLAGLVAQATGAALLVTNGVSTQAYEDILHYAGFDAPLGDTLATVQAKERNVMLDDLGREGLLDVVDVDRIVAEKGMWAHLPDGVHPSGAVQAAVRDEICALLRARGIAGFG